MKFLKKLLWTLLTLSLIVLGSGVFISYQYGDKIKFRVVELLNQQLTAKVDVGEIEFSLFSHFPKASVVFNEVIIHSTSNEKDTLLSAEKVGTSLNLIDLYHGEYTLKTLFIEHGKCQLEVDKEGIKNYLLWKSEESTSDTTDAQIVLEKFSIKDVRFSYLDFQAQSTTAFYIEEADIEGAFQKEFFEASISTQLGQFSIESEGNTLVNIPKATLELNGNVDQLEESINFSEAEIIVNELRLLSSGKYVYSDKSFIDIRFDGDQISLTQIIDLLPVKIQEKTAEYHVSGTAALSGTVLGSISKKTAPYYTLDIAVKNGAFTSKKHELEFDNLSLNGHITNGDQRNKSTTVIKVDTFVTRFREGDLSGKFEIANLNKPFYTTSIDFQMLAEEISLLFEFDDFERLKGTVKGSILSQGRLKDSENFDVDDWKSTKLSAKIQLDQIDLFYRADKIDIQSLSSILNIENNSIAFDSLTSTINNNDVWMSGKFNNLIPYFISDKENLLVDIDIESPQLNLDDFLVQTSNSASTEESINLNSNVYVYADIHTKQLSYKHFRLEEFSTQFIHKPGRIQLNDCKFIAEGGSINGEFILDQNNDQSFNFLVESSLNEVNINRLFQDFNDFGQSTLSAENVSGVADIDIECKGTLSPALSVNSKSLRSDLSITLKDGQLLDFKPLYKLSDYIEIEELRNVRFKTLQNQILIKDETIFIPQFEIKSSALDLNISGTHQFDNQIDYHLNLYLSELLSRKAKKPSDNEFGYVVEEENGRSRLFLSIGGTTENPIVKYDKQAVKEKNREQFAKEKQTLKSLLKEEFGLFKKDKTIQPIQAPTKKSPFQVEYDSTFKREGGKKEVKQRSEEQKKDPKSKKKSKFGKFLDKIAEPNEDEFVDPD